MQSRPILTRAWERAGLARIAAKVLEGRRLSLEDGIALYNCPDLLAVGSLANLDRERRHGDIAYYVINQHINHTNICVGGCRFCAFGRARGAEDAYFLTLEKVEERVRSKLAQPITEIHIVGGLTPMLPWSFYPQLLRRIKAIRPGVHLKAFTMVELEYLSREMAKKPLPEMIEELKEAGLDSCPGGGAEVFSERVHQAIYKGKISGDAWLETARTVHRSGLKTNATMLYGHVETIRERVEHLLRLRELQDETGGFVTFIPLAFHPANTQLAHLPETTGDMDLRAVALARLMLDNFDHIKAYWIMITPKVSQTAMYFGADDFDGTVDDEEIVHYAGARTPQYLSVDELLRHIRDAGRRPVERDTLFNIVGQPAGQTDPDRPPVPMEAPASDGPAVTETPSRQAGPV
ncbi:MAG: aminofutalosine synthase MqnE [Acidobacteriota bacterium]